MSFDSTSFSVESFSTTSFLLTVADIGLPIVNAGATQPTANSYSVCQISGFRALPGALVERWDGLLVLPIFSEPRNEQDFVRVYAEKLKGSVRPESQDVFLADNEVTIDDL